MANGDQVKQQNAQVTSIIAQDILLFVFAGREKYVLNCLVIIYVFCCKQIKYKSP